MHANKQNQIDSLHAGDIAALVGFKDIKNWGYIMKMETNCVRINGFSRSSYWNSNWPKTQADVDKMGMALAKLSEGSNLNYTLTKIQDKLY